MSGFEKTTMSAVIALSMALTFATGGGVCERARRRLHPMRWQKVIACTVHA
jgi:hypothetical protein